jgi:hypothetical protein
MELTVNKDGQDLGPYSLEELQAELTAGNLSQEDHAWYEGCEDWVSVADIPGVGEEQPTEKAEGIHLEKGGPFPLAQVQGMLNQGVLSMEDAAWLDGWDDWSTLADVPGLKKPRVRVAGGSPLSGLTPAGDADEKPKKAKKNKNAAEENAAESGKGKRSRKKKAKKKSGSLVQRLMPLLLLVILAAAGFGGFLIYQRMVEGDTVEDIFKNPTAKEDPPPIDDPWAYTEWRTKRQR